MKNANKANEGKGPGMEQAYAEVYQLLLHMTRDIQKCIPLKFMQFLEANMDATWSGNLDFSKKLMDMDLLRDTRVLPSLVYRDFLCSPQEREELIRKDKQEAILGGWEYDSFSLMELC